MRDPLGLATAYLAAPALSFWRWTEGGRVITWSDGSTIAFREEVEHVLRRLAPQGLPPFGAVALLLAACRPGWRETGRAVLEAHGRALERVSTLAGRYPPDWMGEVVQGLNAVNALRLENRTGADAKAALADLVFDGLEARGGPEEATAIADAVAEGPVPAGAAQDTVSKWIVFRFLQDLSLLRHGLARVSDDALELRRRTGLERLPVPADVADLPAAESVRRLLSELKDDRELAGLARLAENLMAAVHVPRRVSDPEELPLGGVSDIANRGPLDRLLVSELAHDETTLAARIALNEALFLRRESPPRNLPGRRAILIDAGIRMWGVPRVFAAAVGLALAATADRQARVTVFRATADGAQPANLMTREGLMEHLGALEAAPVPAKAVEEFIRASNPTTEPVDAILVTHEDVLADPAFGAALAGLDDRALEVATVARSGAYRMWSVTRRGRRLLREATLSLEDVLEPPKTEARGVPLLPEPHDDAFPVVLSLERPPFLLPHDVDPRRAAPHPERGVVAATRDGRLMFWGRPHRGARELTALLPRGTLHWIALEDDGMSYALLGASRSTLQLVAADTESGRCALMRLPATGYPPVGVFRHHDALCLAYGRKMDVFDIRSGEILEVHPLDAGLSWVHGRYFRSRAGWSAVAFDGRAASFEAVRSPRARHDAGFVALWDRRGQDGPWALNIAGQVLGLADGREIRFDHSLPAPVHLIAVSRDGHRAVLRGADRASGLVLLNLETGKASRAWGDPHLALEPTLARLPRRSVRYRFGAIGTDTSSLILMSTTGSPCSIALAPEGKSIALETRKAPPVLIEVPFTPCPSPRGTRYSLRVASWKDGSRAWLDSRGMMHLKSSDPRIPEVSLALAADGPLAGWSSDGRLCGPDYWIDGKPTAEAHAVFTSIFRFVSALP